MASFATVFPIQPLDNVVKASYPTNDRNLRPRRARSIRKDHSAMQSWTKNISRNVEDLFGTKVARKVTITVAVPETLTEAVAYFGGEENLIKWAIQGARSHALVLGSNAAIAGVGGDAQLAKTFKASLKTLIEIMGFTKEQALSTLLSKPQFASLAESVKNSLSSPDMSFDYGATAPKQPAWFVGEVEDDEETPTAA